MTIRDNPQYTLWKTCELSSSVLDVGESPYNNGEGWALLARPKAQAQRDPILRTGRLAPVPVAALLVRPKHRGREILSYGLEDSLQ